MPIFVNQVEITDDEVHAEMQYHPADSVDEARHQAAQALVIRQLLLQAAQEQELFDSTETATAKELEDSIDELIRREVSVPEADVESCQRYYEQNRERFTDRRSQKALPFERVQVHIRDYLEARSLRTGIVQYIKVLAGRARIAGFELAENEGALVQ